MRSFAAALVVLLGSSTAFADDQEILGVVLCVGDVDGRVAVEAARDTGGATWRAAEIAAEPLPSQGTPDEAVAALRSFYLEADFLRCLSQLSDRRLDRTALVAEGHLEAAAAVFVFGGACALGAEDADLATSLFDELAALELPASQALEVVSPDVQQLAETRRQALARRRRVHMRLVSSPAGATLEVDGVRKCSATPCEVSLPPGEHVLVVEALGHVPRMERRALEGGDEVVELALDPAPSGVARNQLADALYRDVSPDDALFIRAASRALGARLVVAVFERDHQEHAAIYDRQNDRVVAESSVSAEEGPALAVRTVVNEWRGETESRPIYASPWFWVATLGAAAVAAVIVGLIVIPPGPRYDIVFGN